MRYFSQMGEQWSGQADRKSTRLNSSHVKISYAVFCWKKKISALAHHKVIQKLASASSVVSSTVGVPNSLGPGELLMHYGTQEQKDYYLPRLAVGQEVPCFGLTGPFSFLVAPPPPRSTLFPYTTLFR